MYNRHYLVTGSDEILKRRDDGQTRADGRLVQELGATLEARADNLIIQRLRTRKRLLVRRHDVHARAKQHRIRIRHVLRGRVVDKDDGLIVAHELGQRVR